MPCARFVCINKTLNPCKDRFHIHVQVIFFLDSHARNFPRASTRSNRVLDMQAIIFFSEQYLEMILVKERVVFPCKCLYKCIFSALCSLCLYKQITNPPQRSLPYLCPSYIFPINSHTRNFPRASSRSNRVLDMQAIIFFSE